MRTFAACLLTLVSAAFAAADGYKLTKTIPVPGDGGWDYLTVDAARRRVDGSHRTQADVIDGDCTVVNGAGKVCANREDKSQIIKNDAKKMTVLERWPLAPGEEPSALAIDPKSHRLFAGCGNKMMVVVDAESGKVIEPQPIGDHVDA